MKITTSIFILTIFLLLSGCTETFEPPYQLGNDPINALKSGFIMQDGEWLYFTDQEKSIARTNGTVTETIENTYGRGLNVSGDYVYFLTIPGRSEGRTGLFRVHKENHDELEQLIDDTYINDLIIVNEHMYYSRFGDSKTGLYRSDLDGQNEKQLLDAMINGLQFHDGWLYTAIASGGSVLKISLKGKKESELKTEDGLPISTTNFIIIDDWIYFENRSDEFDMHYTGELSMQNNNIYRMKLDGSSLEYATKGNLALVDNKQNTQIYYLSQEGTDGERQLIRMDVDTGEKSVLYQGQKFLGYGNKIGEDLFFIDWAYDPEELISIYRIKSGREELELFNE